MTFLLFLLKKTFFPGKHELVLQELQVPLCVRGVGSWTKQAGVETFICRSSREHVALPQAPFTMSRGSLKTPKEILVNAACILG